MAAEPPDLTALRQRLEEESAAYADVLARLDRLASFALPHERLPRWTEQRRDLDQLSLAPPEPPTGRGLRALWHRLRARLTAHVALRLERQREYDARLLGMLDEQLVEMARLHTHLRELAACLVRYFQRIEPLVDARDRLSSALATTRAELILEAFDRRQESLARRVEGLSALGDRLEALATEAHAVRETLSAAAPPPALAALAREAAEGAAYVAFQNRFRGSREEIRDRLQGYVELLGDAGPVVDLGCGRGELIELLRERGIEARGVESNASSVTAGRARGLDIVHGQLTDFLRQAPDASLGAVVAIQVAEHLPPSQLMDLIRDAQRALRSGGLLLIETINPRSVVGFLEAFTRDLTHERPLHPETLRFLVATAGFSEVRTEWRSPVEPAARLTPIPADGLPEATAQALNENVGRLNALIYGPHEYVLIARR